MTKREIAEAAVQQLAMIGMTYADIGRAYMYKRIEDDEIDDVIRQAREAAEDISEALGELRGLLVEDGE